VESDVDLIHVLLRGRGGNRSSVDLVAARLWAGRSRVQIPVKARDLSVVHNIHTGSGAHPADAVYTLNPYISDTSSLHVTFWCLFNRTVMLVKFYFAV